jgi:ubiquinone/menaquinone biosynthesis C-methylase UbiE
VKLNVGCGGGKYAFCDLKCEVNSDIQRPKTKVPNFILSDIGNLPFKDKAFQKVYAYNVLEHVMDHNKALRELNRISNEVVIRFDKIYNLANRFTADHESITIEYTLRLFPGPIRWIAKLVRFPIDHNKVYQNMIHNTFPVLRKLGLLDKWNYYRIK